MKFPRIETLRVEPMYDAEQRVVEYIHLTFVATAWVYQDESDVQDISVGAKQLSIAQILATLSKPKSDFNWYERTATSPHISMSPTHTGKMRTSAAPQAKAGAATFIDAVGQDVFWGPKPIVEVITNMPGCIQVRFAIEAHLSPEIVAGIGENVGSGSRIGSDIISHTAAVQYVIDQDHYTTRHTQGTIRYRHTLEVDADEYRSDIFMEGALSQFFRPVRGTQSMKGNNFTAGVALPAHFVRQAATYSIGVERNSLSYVIIDREVYRTPPPPATTIEAQMEVTAQGHSLQTFRKRLVGVVQGNRLTSKAELITTILQLINTHILTTPLVFVEEAKLVDFLYENRIAFVFDAIQAPGLMIATFAEAGIFIEPPSEGQHFMQDLRGTAHLKGSGYNLNRASGAQEPFAIRHNLREINRRTADKFYAELIAKYRKLGVQSETGLIVHEERLELHYIAAGETQRRTNSVDDEGVVSASTTTSTSDYVGDLYVVVWGVKLGMLDPKTKKPPAGPAPSVLWNCQYEKYIAMNEMGLGDKLPITGRLVVYPVSFPSKLKSKLGGEDLYEIAYSYVIKLHPLLVQKLLLNMADNNAEILQGITWPLINDSLRDDFVTAIQTQNWTPNAQGNSGKN